MKREQRPADRVSAVRRENESTEYALKNETGEGSVRLYRPFPGVAVIFYDLHMESVRLRDIPPGNRLIIDHCRIGRSEWESSDHRCIFCEAGDLQINRDFGFLGNIYFPLRHYHGVSIVWDIDKAEEQPEENRIIRPESIRRIREKFCAGGATGILRGSQRIENVFSELYDQRPEAVISYCRLKAMELMLFLDGIEPTAGNSQKSYCSRSQLEKVKEIERFITGHSEKRFTLSELSERFDFPLTSMKQCFKCVYGMPVYSYLKLFRMNKAALLLRQTDKSILEIAGCVGYENAGKFSEAFTSVMGQKPLNYRRTMSAGEK